MPEGWITAPKLFGRPSSRWSGGLILLLVAMAVAAALVERNSRQSYHARLTPGDPMPPYTAVSIDGTEVSIGDFAGSAVLLTFWATWCSSCVDQLTEMQLFTNGVEGQGLEIISVNIDKDDRAGVQEFWDRRGYGWLNLFDDPSRVESVFGWGNRYPKTVLVNRDGTVGVWWQGELDLDLPRNRSAIEEAISSRDGHPPVGESIPGPGPPGHP
jgi:peroxiredoxin